MVPDVPSAFELPVGSRPEYGMSAVEAGDGPDQPGTRTPISEAQTAQMISAALRMIT